MRFLAFAAVGSCLMVLAGCKAFDESLLDPADSGPSCPLSRPPARPNADVVPDGDDGETYFWASRDLRIDYRDDRWRTAGYDLDGLCSVGPNPPVECRAPALSAPLEEDGVMGTDNSLGHNIAEVLLLAFPDLQDELRGYQTQGTGTTLIQVTGWNGEDDDPRVVAVLSQSIFGTSEDPGEFTEWSISGEQLTIDGEPWPLPNWDGNDLWWARDDNFLDRNPDRPTVRDDNAWIADRTLVMRVPDRFPIIYGGDMRAAQFILSDAVLTLKISADDQTVEKMVIAGRFAIVDLLSTIGTAGGCPGSSDYESFSHLLDLAADIRARPGSGGPDAVCDALSVGLVYESGSRARFGGIAPGTEVPNPCVDGGVGDGGMDGGMPDGAADSSTPDSSTPDSAVDSGVMDTGAMDGGVPDSGTDASAAMDAAMDGG